MASLVFSLFGSYLVAVNAAVIQHRLINPDGVIYTQTTGTSDKCLKNLQDKRVVVASCDGSHPAFSWTLIEAEDGYQVKSDAYESQCWHAVPTLPSKDRLKLVSCHNNSRQRFQFENGFIYRVENGVKRCVTANNKDKLVLKKCIINRFGLISYQDDTETTTTEATTEATAEPTTPAPTPQYILTLTLENDIVTAQFTSAIQDVFPDLALDDMMKYAILTPVQEKLGENLMYASLRNIGTDPTTFTFTYQVLIVAKGITVRSSGASQTTMADLSVATSNQQVERSASGQHRDLDGDTIVLKDHFLNEVPSPKKAGFRSAAGATAYLDETVTATASAMLIGAIKATAAAMNVTFNDSDLLAPLNVNVLEPEPQELSLFAYLANSLQMTAGYEQMEAAFHGINTQLTEAPVCPASAASERIPDGSCNSASSAVTGKKGSILRQLGRSAHNKSEPAPQTVASNLMHPRDGQPRQFSDKHNQLCSVWIQFMLHDWVVISRDEGTPIEGYGPHAKAAKFVNDEDKVYMRNNVTHWWDVNTLYGSDATTQANVRTHVGGKLVLADNGESLARDADGRIVTGFAENWWSGLEWIHLLFIKEHNYIAEQIASHNPTFDDEQIFQKARIVVSGIINSIHTGEWTPTLFDHDVFYTLTKGVFPGPEACNAYVTSLNVTMKLRTSLYVYCGLASAIGDSREGLTWGWASSFASVYRLHQLLPDSVDGLGTLREMIHMDHQAAFNDKGLSSIGEAFMGSALGLPRIWNYPMDLTSKNGFKVDLPSLEIFRDRELGGLRYVEWMEKVNLKVPQDWSDISPNAEIVEALKATYKTIHEIDLIIGLYAHFDFDNTPGHVVVDPSYVLFTLQTPQRTFRDKFFMSMHNADTYTEWGFNYVQTTVFKDILERHGHTVENENPFRLPGAGNSCAFGGECAPPNEGESKAFYW